MDRSLYDEDFYLWTQSQAAALLNAGGAGSAPVDWELVAEEVRNLGGSLLRECESRIATIIEHLYKLAWSARNEPRAGWRTTILTQRVEYEAARTASIERIILSRLEPLHERALKLARASFAEHEPDAPRDETLRWSLPQILGHADDPLAPAAS